MIKYKPAVMNTSTMLKDRNASNEDPHPRKASPKNTGGDRDNRNTTFREGKKRKPLNPRLPLGDQSIIHESKTDALDFIGAASFYSAKERKDEGLSCILEGLVRHWTGRPQTTSGTIKQTPGAQVTSRNRKDVQHHQPSGKHK